MLVRRAGGKISGKGRVGRWGGKKGCEGGRRQAGGYGKMAYKETGERHKLDNNRYGDTGGRVETGGGDGEVTRWT